MPKEPTPPASAVDEAKLAAFTAIVTALTPLDRPSRTDVLRAAACFSGIVVVLERPL